MHACTPIFFSRLCLLLLFILMMFASAGCLCWHVTSGCWPAILAIARMGGPLTDFSDTLRTCLETPGPKAATWHCSPTRADRRKCPELKDQYAHSSAEYFICYFNSTRECHLLHACMCYVGTLVWECLSPSQLIWRVPWEGGHSH